MSIFKNQTDNDDLLASDLAVVYGAPRMSPPREAEQRQRLVEFATTLDRVAAHNGGMSAMVMAADTGTEKKGLGRYLRGLATAVVVLITTTAGVSTVAHNVWGTKTPIVVNVTIPALQQHTTAAPRPASLRAKPAVQLAWHPVTQWFGRTANFNNLVGADPVSSVTIVGQAFTVPNDPNQTAGAILHMYTDSYKPEGSQAQFNNDLLGGHTLRLTLGCDDSSSIGASTTVRVRNQNGRQLFKTDVQQGQPATESTIDLGTDTHVVTIWATPASSGCSLGIPFPAVR